MRGRELTYVPLAGAVAQYVAMTPTEAGKQRLAVTSWDVQRYVELL